MNTVGAGCRTCTTDLAPNMLARFFCEETVKTPLAAFKKDRQPLLPTELFGKFCRGTRPQTQLNLKAPVETQIPGS